ncbi:putative phosphatase YcdX [Clostridium tepidiprofundi DSM 19306]|uniref:Putative phosphatase YcdX n=1 Tax=Clostridium tepidiprofundi DSM 19306 TaxID=1121338 RepID=A0A151B629_9CLOT|nr:phosphatase [Clostridium tepidiprofundi]KYH35395.1 putative phosphatase YcdX [Clostridium tepidiprofundi DSM 19306]
MKFIADLHTHTLVSGHAYSTMMENIREASKKGIEILGVTDHGPSMPGGPHIFYFGNMKVLPREIEGVMVLKGCEANIIDYDGNLDIPKSIQDQLDIMIASLHDVCIKPGSVEENTRAYLKAMDNPNVHIIGHPGNPSFPIDKEAVVKKAKEKDILIEINNSSFVSSRIGSEANCLTIAQLCKKYGVKVIAGSDAHTCFHVGEFGEVIKLLSNIEMPEELIISRSKNEIIEYLKNKGKLKDVVLD